MLAQGKSLILKGPMMKKDPTTIKKLKEEFTNIQESITPLERMLQEVKAMELRRI